jgi:DNA-nicking Smr family endonuclease
MHAQVLRPKPEDMVFPAAGALTPEKPVKQAVPRFRLGERSNTATAPAPTTPALQMDAKAFGKMTKGKLSPEARIDLHGMTLAEAHPELIRFILNAHGDGLRLVLVITGKGKPGVDHGPIPQRGGVLRHQVPHWLRQAPLAPCILQMTEAHLRHGGGGAFYVYLRRHR